MANTKIAQRQISGGLDGWIPAEETWTYASASTFTISGDKTGKYQKGDKIKLTQTTVKYFYIIGVSYSAPNTTVTVTGGTDYTVANAAITLPYFSKIVTPQGFPQAFAFTPILTTQAGTVTTYSASGYFTLIGNFCYIRYVVSVTNNGSGGTAALFSLPITGQGDITATFVGREYLSTGSIIQGMATDSTHIRVLTYNNQYPLGTGYAISLSGNYTIA